MLLILKRISPTTLVPDIERFFQPTVKGGLLSRKGRIDSIKIQLLKPPAGDKFELNALVEVEPDAVARRVMRELNRKPLNGKHINIDEFHFRNRDNDRRMSRYQNVLNRRRTDRRRLGMEIRDVTAHKKRNVDAHARGWSTDITL
jgi:hypothetical protein